jgi:SAM-dependent methyltransferase
MKAIMRLIGHRLQLLADTYHRIIGGPFSFACAVCGRRVRAFRPLPEYYFRHLQEAGWPYGIDQAETCNAKQYTCPYCGAPDRDRLTALYLESRLRTVTGPITVIDFAPSQPLTAFIHQLAKTCKLAIRYRTADLSGVGVDDRVDITDMPAYATDSVDLFICCHVLEHVSDDRKAMRELVRILRPGGRGIILVPIVVDLKEIDEDPAITDPRERWRRFGQDDHVRLYAKDGFVSRLNEAGFMIHQLGLDYFGADRFTQQGITSRSVLYVVEKPVS